LQISDKEDYGAQNVNLVPKFPNTK